MSFGRNPHVARAQAEEQKAQATPDPSIAERAWREAARQWDRAAERETDAKRRQEYAANAQAARATADGSGEPTSAASNKPPKWLN